MMHKKLIFCSILVLFQAINCINADAVDFIRAEDEDILWDTDAHGVQTLNGNLTTMTADGYNQSGDMVIEVPEYAPSLGVPIHAVKVPDEVNARAPLYDNPELIKAYRPTTAQQEEYPVNVSSAPKRESSKMPEDMELMMRGYSPQMIAARRDRVAFYKNAIHDCLDKQNDNLGIEMGTLNDGSLYENTAYLTQTFEEIEQCYDNIGLDIIDEFYANDDNALRDYNARSAEFHVSGGGVGLDTKYCGENCSVKALAELQIDKFSDFRVYLYNLLHKAPMAQPEFDCSKQSVTTESAPIEADRYVVRSANNQQMRPARRTLRVRTPDGDIKYVRLNDDGEYELMNENDARQTQYVSQPRAVRATYGTNSSDMQFDVDGVPLIDEDDL